MRNTKALEIKKNKINYAKCFVLFKYKEKKEVIRLL